MEEEKINIEQHLTPLQVKTIILNKLNKDLQELESLPIKKGWGVKVNIIKANLKKSIYWAKQLKP